MIKANYHTHHKLCNHASGNTFDYVKQAIEYGFEEIGISDHNPMPKDVMCNDEFFLKWTNRNMQLDEFYNIYLKELDEVVEKYEGKIRVLKGLEAEFIPSKIKYYEELRSHLDYMNLGLHFFIDDDEVVKISYKDVNSKTVYEYANFAVKAMQTGLYDIFVHPDVFMYSYINSEGEKGFDNHCEKATRIIVEGAIKNNVYLEINVGGIRSASKNSKKRKWLYPEIEFWKIVSQYQQAMVIIGSDAHKPNELLDNDLKEAINMAKSLGIKTHEKIKLKNK